MLVLIASVSGDGCSRVQRELRYPCRCQQLPGAEGVEGDLVLDCNQVVFPGDFPALPYRAPVVSFSQRWVGHQNLPPQAFAQAGKYSLLSQCKKVSSFLESGWWFIWSGRVNFSWISLERFFCRHPHMTLKRSFFTSFTVKIVVHLTF